MKNGLWILVVLSMLFTGFFLGFAFSKKMDRENNLEWRALRLENDLKDCQDE